MTEQVKLTQLQQQMVVFFGDAVRVLGLPRSVGEIYGLLFGSEDPLSLDDLVLRLGVSKGTGSQGLKMLRTLGAVKVVQVDRKSLYIADAELKSLAGGFIREQIRPHLSSAGGKIQQMRDDLDGESEWMSERVERLENWRRKASLLLPVLQKFLGS